MTRSRVNDQMQNERQKLVQEREKLLRQVDILNANIALIDKFCGNGKLEPTIPLNKAAPQVMEAMKRFTRRQLTERIKQEFPSLHFSEHSLSKPLSLAIKKGAVKIAQPNIGSKMQAVYEWIND